MTPYRDGEVYALSCTGCGSSSLEVVPESVTTALGDPAYRTTITCVRCGAQIRSLLWRDAGRWYTSGDRVAGPELEADVPPHR